MKALTLHQPWASLVAQGTKVYETRSWPPPGSLIGQRIAIHAGLNEIGKHVRFSFGRWPKWEELPRGVVVCTARLHSAYRLGLPCSRKNPNSVRVIESMGHLGFPPTFIEGDEYGDYHTGRWAWRLVDVELLEPPVPARGHQGLWELELATGGSWPS